MTTNHTSAADTSTRGSHDRAAVPMAVLLWVAVVLALAYGVASTMTKVVALFG